MTNIQAIAYKVLPIPQGGQSSYTFPFWTIQNAAHDNTKIVVQILDGTNIRTLTETTHYSVTVDSSLEGGTIFFDKGFTPTGTDGQYLMVVSNIPFKQGTVFNQPATAHQIKTAFDNQQQQINQLKECCDRAIHTQFDPKTQTYPIISLLTKDFKPNHLVILDHTGNTIVDAGFGKDELDQLKKEVALVNQNIQTIANFAAAAGSAAAQATTEAANAAQSALSAAAEYNKVKTEAEKAIKNVDAKANSAVSQVTTAATNAITNVNTEAKTAVDTVKLSATNAVTQIDADKKAAAQAIATATATLNRTKDDALAKLAAALLSITNLTKTSIAEISQKLADVLKLIGPQVQLATDQAQIAVQAATDAQTAESNTKVVAQHVDSVNAALAPINTLFTGAGTKDDIVTRNTAGKWAVEGGSAYVKSLLLGMMANGQLLWRDQDAIAAIDRTSLGGGGGGGGVGPYDHKVIHLGQDDGTAPVTQQKHQEHYAMLQVPYADDATQPARAGKTPRINSTGDNWEYETMPAPGDIFTMLPTPGTTTVPQIDLSKLILPNVSAQYGLTANFDKPTNKWTFTATQGGNMGNEIPNPPNDGKNYFVDTFTATNGGVNLHLEPIPFPKPTAQDIGKIAVVDSTHKAFEYVMPIKETEVTKRIFAQTGVVDSPKIRSMSGLTFNLDPFSVAYTDPATKVMTEHSYTGVTAISVTQDATNTVYIDPSDWTIHSINGEPTETIKAANIVLCVVYSKSDIQHIKWAYNPISHQERVLAEMARALGSFGKGVFLTIEAKGLVSKGKGYIYDFVGRGLQSKHLVGDIATFYKMMGGLISPTTTSLLLEKVYYDSTAQQENALDAQHPVVIHAIVSGASLATASSHIIDKAILVIGTKTYSSKENARRHLSDERANLQIASLVATNMVLLAQVIISHGDNTNTDIEIINYAALKSSTFAIIREDRVPQGSLADENSVLRYTKGKYIFDKGIIPPVIDPNIKDGDVIVSAGGNKLKGVDPATLHIATSSISTKMINIGIEIPVNSAVKVGTPYIAGTAGVTGHGILSAEFSIIKGMGVGGTTNDAYNIKLSLEPGVIKSQSDVKRVRVYGVALTSYSWDAQYIYMTAVDELTIYQIIRVTSLGISPTSTTKLSITVFFGGD